LLWTSGDRLHRVRGLWFLAEPRDSALEALQLRVETTPIAGGTEFAVTTANLVREMGCWSIRMPWPTTRS